MNEAIHGKWNLIKKCLVLELGKSEINIFSPEKHIDKIFSDTFRMLKIIWMAFHFLVKDMMRKNYNYNDQTKLNLEREKWK